VYRLEPIPEKGEKLPRPLASLENVISGMPRSLGCDRSGERLIYVSATGKLASWSWRGNNSGRATNQRASHLAVSPDGRWVATLESNWNAVVCDRESGKQLLALPQEEGEIWSLAWSPDGTRLALGLIDGDPVIWDLEQVRARLAEFGLSNPSTRTVATAGSKGR
jgi:WD40 repeat protein